MSPKNAKDKLVFIEPDLTVTQIDYLATIGEVLQSDGTARSSDIARAMDVTRSTVSTTLKSLAATGFIHAESYGPVTLTEKGAAISENVCAMRKALEALLTDVLGLDSEQARAAARAYKGVVHPAVPEQLAVLRRFMQKTKKKWRQKMDD